MPSFHIPLQHDLLEAILDDSSNSFCDSEGAKEIFSQMEPVL